MEKKVCIGKIVSVHGIRGEVKVRSYTSNPTDLDKYGDVENQTGNRIFKIKVVGFSKDNLRVKIEGVSDRNTAETLVGTEFYVNRNIFPELGEEEFYQTDLIGLKVYLKSLDEEIGVVVGLSNFGAGEILEIKLNTQKDTEMLPFTKQYVPTINLEEGYIIVSSATMIFAEDGASVSGIRSATVNNPSIIWKWSLTEQLKHSAQDSELWKCSATPVLRAEQPTSPI